ncbi:PD-(D/E)XK nuclease family protein [Methylobacterium planeticum]|uniref:Oxidoreductase n=1 Tax=Methylobacterium planeticum TaxID=2615211 RepID=A0A6N6MF21_9HYPH|nr:oxidoreductase [Methylobacterium planeticum]KAB1068884.1 oxidoreductase [Methylobacterium planeticum]
MAALPPPQSHTVLAIDAAYVEAARTGDSAGVPMSGVANPCDRALWYQFRWAAPGEGPEGARQRRFESGEIYEHRLLDMLRMIGCQVWEIDETTGKQIRVDLAGGHLRGKLDAVARGLPEAPATPHAIECKSSNDKSFKAIVKGPIRETKPEHFAQIQLYLHALDLRRGLYMLANKNDDAVHCERVEYDPVFCLALVARIERVVAAPRPPARLHDDPTSKAAFACQWCPARAICHEAAFPRQNCRTCMASTPSDGPRWDCERHKGRLSYDGMQAGCPDHLFIPELVPGSQEDADPERGTVTYRMADGSVWVDGAGRERAA